MRKAQQSKLEFIEKYGGWYLNGLKVFVDKGLLDYDNPIQVRKSKKWRTNKKFIKRFQYLESESKKDGKNMGEMTLEEMDEYWERAKNI